MQPLVLTLTLDPAVQARLDAERTRLFPPGRTQVGAHVTLFHALPGEICAAVLADLHAQVGPAFEVTVGEVMSLGHGAAYRLVSPELQRRHRALQQGWWPHLTAQDRQGFRPHATVQNKVTPEIARTTVTQLRAGFEPFTIDALGWTLWRYDDGPWTHLHDIAFT